MIRDILTKIFLEYIDDFLAVNFGSFFKDI